MIRPLHLADVAALLFFLGRSPANEAKARGRLGDEGWELAAAVPAIRDCLVAHDSHLSYVCVRGGAIHGLACLQGCCGPQVWEMERLLVAPGHEECVLDLLDRLGCATEEIGRVFLRLSAGSAVIDAAKQAGFTEYLTEARYRLDVGRRVGKTRSTAVRPKTQVDDHSVFRLYSSLVPLKVRTVGGMTFEEWNLNRDRGEVREYVLGDGGDVRAWMRVRRDGSAGQFDMLVGAGSEDVDLLLDHALSVLSRSRPVYCLVPEFGAQQQRALEERGFRHEAEFRCLIKEMVARVHEPRLVPLSA